MQDSSRRRTLIADRCRAITLAGHPTSARIWPMRESTSPHHHAAPLIAAHAFSHGFQPDQNERLAAYWAEALGGPSLYSHIPKPMATRPPWSASTAATESTKKWIAAPLPASIRLLPTSPSPPIQASGARSTTISPGPPPPWLAVIAPPTTCPPASPSPAAPGTASSPRSLAGRCSLLPVTCNLSTLYPLQEIIANPYVGNPTP